MPVICAKCKEIPLHEKDFLIFGNGKQGVLSWICDECKTQNNIFIWDKYSDRREGIL